jgi:hypothetical protein
LSNLTTRSFACALLISLRFDKHLISLFDLAPSWLSRIQTEPMTRMNPLSPDHMSADERLAEICEMLACGLVRLEARQSSQLSGDRGESCLPISVDRCRHAERLASEGGSK